MNLNELVKKAQKGNEDAFYELMLSCKDQLYRIAYSYLESEQDSLEAIQETTFRAYRKLSKLKDPNYFKTWVIRILINYCIDEQRRLHKVSPLVYEKGVLENNPAKTETEKVELDMVVEQLEGPLKQIIILKYFEDLTIKDIADIMEKPEGTIKGWLNKALNQLRIKLSEGGK